MRRKDRGFTLVEILMVVAIMAIAAMVVPLAMSRNTESISATSAARMVMADLSYAQSVAQTRQQRVYVVVRKPDATYTGYDLAYITSPSAAENWVYTPDRGRWITRFGAAGNGQTAPGALKKTQLLTVRLENADGTAVGGQDPVVGVPGFDAQGRPLLDNAGTISSPAGFTAFLIANSKGDVRYKIRIAPITGDISMTATP